MLGGVIFGTNRYYGMGAINSAVTESLTPMAHLMARPTGL